MQTKKMKRLLFVVFLILICLYSRIIPIKWKGWKKDNNIAFKLEDSPRFLSQTTASSNAKPMQQQKNESTHTTLQHAQSMENTVKSSPLQSHDQKNVTLKCASWHFPKNWEYTVKPRIVLDPYKFLYPGLVWGPNNQISGLKQSIYLAIRLNRTLAIPLFLSHYTSEGGEQAISPYQTVDVERLCRFVSCISLPDLRKTCDGAFDVALQAMRLNSWDLRRFERDTGMDIINIKKKLTSVPGSINFQVDQNVGHIDIPALPNITTRMRFDAWLSPDSIQKVYNTAARCAIYTGAFQGIYTKLKNDVAFPLSKALTNVTIIPDDVLYSAVTDAVRHPPCIVEAAKSYVKDVLNGEEYVAVHWRYDEKDWRRNCRNEIINKLTEEMCKNLLLIKPKDLAKGIALNFPIQKEEQSKTFVYIATPPLLSHFKEGIFSEFKNISKLFKKPAKTLEQFLDNNYRQCWISSGWLKVSEVVSIVEMEIMLQSSWFFYSRYSSWSKNVMPLRREKLDNGIYKQKFTKPAYEIALAQSKL